VDGTVRVRVVIDEHGEVIGATVVQSIPLLDAAAVEAVRRWRFKPARDCEGKPIRTWVEIPVKFSLH
jgi:protein TonB